MRKKVKYTPKSIQLDAFAAKKAGDAGLQQAEDNANKKQDGWVDHAYSFFLQWLFKKPVGFEFMLEDVRVAATSIATLQKPPSERAWGGIARRALRDKLIIHAGHGKTKNKLAHGTPASIWKKL
jgi:hypothetical protein